MLVSTSALVFKCARSRTWRAKETAKGRERERTALTRSYSYRLVCKATNCGNYSQRSSLALLHPALLSAHQIERPLIERLSNNGLAQLTVGLSRSPFHMKLVCYEKFTCALHTLFSKIYAKISRSMKSVIYYYKNLHFSFVNSILNSFKSICGLASNFFPQALELISKFQHGVERIRNFLLPIFYFILSLHK